MSTLSGKYDELSKNEDNIFYSMALKRMLNELSIENIKMC